MEQNDATTFSLMTLCIMTFGLTLISLKTDYQKYKCSDDCHIEPVIQNVIMLSVIVLSVCILNVIMLTGKYPECSYA
jgi:hypothetical protein